MDWQLCRSILYPTRQYNHEFTITEGKDFHLYIFTYSHSHSHTQQRETRENGEAEEWHWLVGGANVRCDVDDAAGGVGGALHCGS